MATETPEEINGLKEKITSKRVSEFLHLLILSLAICFFSFKFFTKYQSDTHDYGIFIWILIPALLAGSFLALSLSVYRMINVDISKLLRAREKKKKKKRIPSRDRYFDKLFK